MSKKFEIEKSAAIKLNETQLNVKTIDKNLQAILHIVSCNKSISKTNF